MSRSAFSNRPAGSAAAVDQTFGENSHRDHAGAPMIAGERQYLSDFLLLARHDANSSVEWTARV